MIYTAIESLLIVNAESEEHKLNELYTEKYKKHIACKCREKLFFANDIFR